MEWLMSLHEAGTWLGGDVGLGGMGKFGLIKKLNTVTDGLGTDCSIIENLPRDLLKPRGSYK